MSRPPCESQCESASLGSLGSISSSPSASTAGAGGESGRDDEIVVSELDAPRAAEATLETTWRTEIVEAVTVFHEVLHALIFAEQKEVLQDAVPVLGK